jgi:hypothetical protein
MITILDYAYGAVCVVVMIYVLSPAREIRK